MQLAEALNRGLPGDRVITDPDVLAALSHDDAEWAPAGRAAAGVRARSEAEVQHVVRTCAELGAPVVPRGAGTGLSGRRPFGVIVREGREHVGIGDDPVTGQSPAQRLGQLHS